MPVGSSFEFRPVSGPASPAAGNTLLYVRAGKVYTKDETGLEQLVGPMDAAIGAASSLNLTQEYRGATKPATPTNGDTLYSRAMARRIPSFVDPSGRATGLQPGLYSGRVMMWSAINNVAALSPFNAGALTATSGTNGAVNASPGSGQASFYTSMVRTRHYTTSAVGSTAGYRAPNPYWHLGGVPGKGGFFFVCRFGLPLGLQATRGFIGMSTTAGALLMNSTPYQYGNFGLGWDIGDANMSIFAGTGAPVQSTNFKPDNSTYFYEFRMYAPTGGGQVVYASLERLNDGVNITTTLNDPTQVPGVDILLCPHVVVGNGATAVVTEINTQSLYLETEN